MMRSENREVTASFNKTPGNGAVALFNRFGTSECAAAVESASQWHIEVEGWLLPFLRRLCFAVVILLVGCQAAVDSGAVDWPEVEKLRFSLKGFRDDGLRGPPDGLTSLTYEFCVPADEQVYAEVRRIDPEVQISPGSRGRIGCGEQQALCLGQTHQPRWREVLRELSKLAYVTEIRECVFE